MRRAMHVIDGLGPQESFFHDHPFFGQLFLAGSLAIIGYPDSLNISSDVSSMEMLYTVPRILMGILAVIDTFLIYRISEIRYNKNVAIIASILFAVMPVTWLLRRILLDSILLPFLLSSILLALYARESKNKNLLAVLSGVCLGIAIFTKIPVFIMIPLVAFLVYSSNRKAKTLGLWFIPVILIPTVWPAQALAAGQFDLWVKDIFWQMQRESAGFTSIVYDFIIFDPVLFALGVAGLVYAAVRKDVFLLLWGVPFVIFLSLIGYVQYFYWIPILPTFCVAAARLVTDLVGMGRKKKLQYPTLLAVTCGIGIFGLVSSTMLVTTHVSGQLEATAFVADYVQDSDSNMTIISSPVYSWIFIYVFDQDNV
ncbi:MAG: ArnT family glycosyltransferase, partial [Nitrososphaerales archaeon]